MATTEDERLAKEITMLSDDLTDDLYRYLDEISTTGDFVTFKKLDKFVDPKIRLIGTGDDSEHDIPIPLGTRDALKLIEAAQLAPSGDGGEVITDTSVGKYVGLNLNLLCCQRFLGSLKRS